MSTSRLLIQSLAFSFALVASLLSAQSKRGTTAPPAASEFPVTMRQNVVAGTTPVGTKVEAKLAIATLVEGKVVPAGAIFSGEVVESAEKSSAAASRLAIRMDSVRWKKGLVPVKVYLTAWYYPVSVVRSSPRDDDDPSLNGVSNSPVRWRKGTGGTNPGGPGAPVPSDHPEASGLELPRTASRLSGERVVIKDTESTPQNDGAILLTSTHSNIKLDKSTTYVLATRDLTSVPPN